jgi:hypothetical protein
MLHSQNLWAIKKKHLSVCQKEALRI